MTRRSICALPCLLAAQDSPTIRVDVRLIRVFTSVRNTSGELVGNLGKEDFLLSDNGVPQQITLFERSTAQPLNVAVLLDISASVAKDLKYEVEASLRFARSLLNEGNQDDVISLITFNHSVDLIAGFTRRLPRLENALKSLQTGAGTSVYDAIYLASEELEGRQGRKVMIVVSDGGDTASIKKFNDALIAAQRSQSAVYPILVVPIQNDAGRNRGGENAMQLIAERSGGRVLQPSSYERLSQSFDDILRDLRTQYLLGYYPKNVPSTANRFHRLEVQIRRPGLRAQSRTGYYEETL
jgi:Ca-activated chloride channel homolog